MLKLLMLVGWHGSGYIISQTIKRMIMKMHKPNYNCVEVIGLRLFKPELRDSVRGLFNDLSACSRLNAGDEAVELALYCHAGIASDWKLIIYRNSVEKAPQKSGIGHHLATALSAFGLIHHAVWAREGNIIISSKSNN